MTTTGGRATRVLHAHARSPCDPGCGSGSPYPATAARYGFSSRSLVTRCLRSRVSRDPRLFTSQWMWVTARFVIFTLEQRTSTHAKHPTNTHTHTHTHTHTRNVAHQQPPTRNTQENQAMEGHSQGQGHNHTKQGMPFTPNSGRTRRTLQVSTAPGLSLTPQHGRTHGRWPRMPPRRAACLTPQVVPQERWPDARL